MDGLMDLFEKLYGLWEVVFVKMVEIYIRIK